MPRLGAIVVVVALLIIVAALTGLIHAAGPNQPPVASFTYSPGFPVPQDVITFDASSSYSLNGLIIQYKWDFGDGSVAITTNPLITHSYFVDGDYTVQLTVTDNSTYASSAVAVIPVRCVVFFRVVILGTTLPVANLKVTAYTYNGTAWVVAPANDKGIEIKYDNMTQPNLANDSTQRYRNPGYTASILRHDASNIGFDIHSMTSREVFFKVEWGSWTAYWPNDTTRVYSYDDGVIETHDYDRGHQAHWDPAASAYVIEAENIAGNGVSPTESNPILFGVYCPPPTPTYYLTVKTSPLGITTIPGQGSYVGGTNVTLTAPTYVNVSTDGRYRFDYWDVDGTPQGNALNPISVQMNSNRTATAHYVMQYSVTFGQTGLSSDTTGSVVTINAVPHTLNQFPYSLWVDGGGSVTYSYSLTVSSSVSGKQFRLNTVSGPSSPISVSSPATVTGNYVTRYLVTFAQAGLDPTASGTVATVNGNAKTYGDLPYSLWVDGGGSVTYSYSLTVSSSVSGRRFRLNTVSGPVVPFTVTGPTTVNGSFVVQYLVTFAQTGLDSSATGTVVAVNSNSYGFVDLPLNLWADSGSSITYVYNNVDSSTTGKRFILTGVAGTTSPITVTDTATVTGNYKAQYRVVVDQTGVGNDFAGGVITIDSTSYSAAGLPVQFWWDQGSSHGFAFASPLTVNSSVHYSWSSTAGLSSLQSGTLTVSTSGSIVGNYEVQNCITFDQVGLDSDFTGTVFIIDGSSYGFGTLPLSFYWQPGSAHSFAFQSPLVVTPNGKQYIWTSTSGLSSAQSGSITVTVFGSVIANYKTQYYLALVTSPLGVNSPSGAGWYDSNTHATVSAAPLVDIMPGFSRYKFSDWTTPDMIEVTNSSAPTTTVLMDKTKNVTANYVAQYSITCGRTGVGSDFTGTVMTIDGTGYASNTLPASFWWDSGSSHTFSFSSPLSVNVSTQYFWTSTTGLTTSQSGTLNIAGPGSVTGNYATENKHQVTFDQSGINTDYTGTMVVIDGVGYSVNQLPVSFWWDASSTHTFAYQSPLIVTPDGKQYLWISTAGLSTIQSGSIVVTTPGSVTGNYKTQHYLSLATNPPGVTTPSGTGWYDAGSNASISTPAFIDIVPGSSRYRFDGWTAADMTGIQDPSRSPTTVLMDQAKTVTANYAVQYKITFDQAGVGPDFTDTIVTIDGVDCNGSVLPVSFLWDDGSIHTFSFASPLVVNPSKQYAWAYTSGLSTSQTWSLTVTTSGSVTGSYHEKVTYSLVISATTGGITNPAVGTYIYPSGTTVQVTAIPDTGFQLDHWEVDNVSVGITSPYQVFVDQDHTLKAIFKPLSIGLSASINPMSGSIQIGESLTFNAIISGGTPPYSYQWYLDSSPVPGATSTSWTYTPQHASTHYVYMKVIDSNGHTFQSSTAVITVNPTPVGGYSTSLARPSVLLSLVAYAAIVILSGVVLTSKKRKRK